MTPLCNDARSHRRLGWKESPLTRADLVSNLINMLEPERGASQLFGNKYVQDIQTSASLTNQVSGEPDDIITSTVSPLDSEIENKLFITTQARCAFLQAFRCFC